MSEIFQLKYWEHHSSQIHKEKLNGCEKLQPKYFGSKKASFCYSYEDLGDYLKFNIGYYIGVDWLIENESSIVVSPKLNSRPDSVEENFERDENSKIDLPDEKFVVEVDYLKMLNICLSDKSIYENIDDLAHIDWVASPIPIEQNQDWLSPLLIIQYLKVLNQLVRKGLMKSFYRVSENLNNKIKGKILVGENIKRNNFKNNFTKTVCNYEVFGFNNTANKFLKKALKFSSSYIENNNKIFGKENNYSKQLLSFCSPAFESISDDVNLSELKSVRFNSLYKEYAEALRLAKLILKRFSYTISETSSQKLSTPPYWIDMPRLFELYVYNILKHSYKKGELTYHYRTYGNELDFLLNSEELKMVIDAKYKPLYSYGINHQDIRQLAGYSRLKMVYEELNIDENKNIDCLIVYPDLKKGYTEDNFDLSRENLIAINRYSNFFKVSVALPVKSVH